MDLNNIPLEDLKNLKAAVEIAKLYAMRLDQPFSYTSYLRLEELIKEAIKDVEFERSRLPFEPTPSKYDVVYVVDSIPITK